MKNRRPFGNVVTLEQLTETGATPEPDGEPPEGSAAAGEEVATPQAARTRRKG
jgi:hypothetical protein